MHTTHEVSPFEALTSDQIENVTGGFLGAIAGLASSILPQIGQMVGGKAQGWLNMAGSIAGQVGQMGGGQAAG